MSVPVLHRANFSIIPAHTEIAMNSTLPNGMQLSVTNIIPLQPSSTKVKVSFELENWPFKDTANRLTLRSSFSYSGGEVSEGKTLENSQNVSYEVVTKGGSTATVLVEKQAIIDAVSRYNVAQAHTRHTTVTNNDVSSGRSEFRSQVGI